eukprot:gb/GECG01009935.1/.p1 GENE.gb/GECG01009935.1/~~gb/GECG01009935.1/.p1  ORF type:complete len:266 (+),score=24.86 gb/GECG01009935.1/:1-798(+)
MPHFRACRARTLLERIALVFCLTISHTSASKEEGEDLRESIRAGLEPCFRHSQSTLERAPRFEMNCSRMYWKASGYNGSTFISLKANEEFDGHNGEIDLEGINGFQGLIAVENDNVTSFKDAPLIHRVHIRSGSTSTSGGFIVREKAQFVEVDACSSSGIVNGSTRPPSPAISGGGICGRLCGLNGEILISNCSSTGVVQGVKSGGITGDRLGEQGHATVVDCFATGNLEGINSGGICGQYCGRRGVLSIQQAACVVSEVGASLA